MAGTALNPRLQVLPLRNHDAITTTVFALIPCLKLPVSSGETGVWDLDGFDPPVF